MEPPETAPETCPCGSGLRFAACCGPYLDGHALPPTAEALMRSRYTAHFLGNATYLNDTLWPSKRSAGGVTAAARRAGSGQWVGLTVIDTVDGGADDRAGTVLFEARFLSGGALHSHRERSRFRKKGGRWYYVEPV